MPEPELLLPVPLSMEDEDEPVPVVLPVVPLGALLPMVPGVVPMLPDELLLVTPVLLEPEPEPELMLPVLLEPELVEPVVLPVPAPVTLGLVAVLGPVGAGTPGVAAPMPVLLGLSVVPLPVVDDCAKTKPEAVAAHRAAARRLLRTMLM